MSQSTWVWITKKFVQSICVAVTSVVEQNILTADISGTYGWGVIWRLDRGRSSFVFVLHSRNSQDPYVQKLPWWNFFSDGADSTAVDFCCAQSVSVVLTTDIDLIWHHSFKRNIKFRDNLKVLLIAAILDQWYFSIEISFLILWITSKYYFSILLFLYFNSWWFFAFFNVLFFWVKMFSSPNIFQCSFSYYYFF